MSHTVTAGSLGMFTPRAPARPFDVGAQAQTSLRRIRLYGKLGAKFGREFYLSVDSPAEAVRALATLLDGFEAWMMKSKDKGVGYAVFLDDKNIGHEQLKFPVGSACIRIAPVILGSKNGGVFNIILGAILIVVGIAVNYFSGGTLAPVGNAIIGMGISMIVGGVIQLLSPQPKTNTSANERPENRPNYSFNGPLNTQAQGNPVPVLYGRLKVGSAVISAGIGVEDGVYIPTGTPGAGSMGGGGGGGARFMNDYTTQVY